VAFSQSVDPKPESLFQALRLALRNAAPQGAAEHGNAMLGNIVRQSLAVLGGPGRDEALLDVCLSDDSR
jgi:hypothetical protein